MEMDTVENKSIQEEQKTADELNRIQQQAIDDLEDPNSPKIYNYFPIGRIKKTFIWAMLALFLYAVWYYSVGSWIEVLISWIALDIYIIVLYLLYKGWKKLRKKEYLGWEQGLYYMGYRMAWLMVIFVGIFSAFVYYHLEYRPLNMPLYTITNGTKTVQFQTMMHIGSQKYYDDVFDTMTSYLDDGYVLYYEGVLGLDEDKENSDKFNSLMGVDFDHEVYDNMAKLFGLVNQENDIYIDAAGNKGFNADVHISYVIDKYEESFGEVDISKIEPPKDINKQLSIALNTMNERQLHLFATVERAMISFLFKNTYLVDPLQNILDKGDFFHIILDERNKVIAKKLMSPDHNKIYIMYGNAHFEGVLALLQEQDPNWKIVGQQDFFALK